MNFGSLIYGKILHSEGLEQKFWLKCRQVLIKWFKDLPCEVNVHGTYLQMPFSHALPIYLKKNPFYDRLPGRVGNFIRQKENYICCIDVGANIGDTIAAFNYMVSMNDKFLAIEPNEHFVKYLHENWGADPNIRILPYLCASETRNGSYQIIEKNGTASILSHPNGNVLPVKSLDEILLENPDYLRCNIIKIDTDGSDFRVIAGAKKIIIDNQPAILFECEFSDLNYIEDILSTLRFLRSSGYSSFFLYDNRGYFMGKYPLTDLSAFLNLVFYQLTSPFYYFDILVLKDEYVELFSLLEYDSFALSVSDKKTQQVALNFKNLI